VAGVSEQQWITISGNPDAEGFYEVSWERGEARVRFDDEQNRVTDISIADPTPEKLRRLPLGRIQASAVAFGEMLGGEIQNPRYRLKRPAKRRLPDTFYRNVATAYSDAVKRGTQPRKTLVADTGAADATVAAWIMKARKLGYLPPAEPGKVSAGKGSA
jgi:hypothetical protein